MKKPTRKKILEQSFIELRRIEKRLKRTGILLLIDPETKELSVVSRYDNKTITAILKEVIGEK